MTIALYRRYRPETFADVIGQEHVTGPLQQALRAGRVGHAYLFSGPRGCGKTTSARTLARALNCAQGPTPEPCGTCESCVALARGGPGSVDVIEIDAASHGGVEDARELREKASYGPAQARYKVYIIDEAHMVTTQGFNALLKIVEEPPPHVKFVFATTEPDKVIGTIRSRTHHYPFRLVPPARLQAYLEQVCTLEQVPVEPGVLSFVIRAGGGSVRDCLSVLDQLMAGADERGLTYAGAAALLGFTEGELLDATVAALAAGDGAAMFVQIDRIIETGHDPRRFVEDLLERLRDLIVMAAVGADDAGAALFRGAPHDLLDRMRQQASAFGPGELSYAADIVNAGLTDMTGATSPRLQLELICARLLLPSAAGEHGLAARLDRIERRLHVAGPIDQVGPPSAAGPADRNERPDAQQAPRRYAGDARDAGDGRDARDPAPAEPGASSGAAPPAPEPGAPTNAGTSRASRASQPDSAEPTGRPPAIPVRSRLDTDAIRRSWPDVLAKIFLIRRVTWTFLSQHAQVLEYDGERLLLGIATRGLANTFRQGNHHEVVRQALIEALGVEARVEARVEGIPTTDTPSSGGARRPDPPAAPERVQGTGRAASRLVAPRAPAGVDGPARRPTGAQASLDDDTAASVDDEDIDGGGGVGQPVIAAVLGGTVIEETRD